MRTNNALALFFAALIIGACGSSERVCEDHSQCLLGERCVDLVCVAWPDAATPSSPDGASAPDGPVVTPDAEVPTPDGPVVQPDAPVPTPDAAVEPDAMAPDAEVPVPDAEVPDAFVPSPECAEDTDCGPCGHCEDGECVYDPVVTLYRDTDDDGYGDAAVSVEVCEQLAGWSSVSGDCDDNNDAVYPGAVELCNGLDNNCDDAVDGLTVGAGLPCGTTDAGVCAIGAVVCASGELICGGAVEPAAEVCDNADNDCDGVVDNGIATTTTTCGTGVCASQGTLSCQGGQMVNSCVKGTPSAEVCDNADNDCDGELDNGQPVFTSMCGAGVCERTGLVLCVNGQFTDSCTPGQPFAVDDSTCNSVDEDCDGSVDEDFVSSVTTCGVGACTSTGSTSCVAGAVSDSCTQGTPVTEDFNGVDDNCDGATDEGFVCDPGLTQLCGPVAEVGTCQFGTQYCVSDSGGSVWSDCFNAVMPAAEVCDNADNDCNGTTDDGLGSSPTTCGQGACASQGTLSCQGGQMVDSCVQGTPSTEACDGLDNDCDGTTDNGITSTLTTCGVGGCASTGTTSCVDGAVVDSCTPGTPAADDSSCNGTDDDCDGVADEDYASSATTCGVGPCAATGTTSCVDGAVVDSCTPGAQTSEVCGDGVDQDCNGSDLACPVTANVTWVAPTGFVLEDIRHNLAGGWVEQSLTTTPATHTAAFVVQPGTAYKVNARLRNPTTGQVLYLAQFTSGFGNSPPCSGVTPLENGDLTMMVGTTAVVCSVASDPDSGSCVANEFCTP